VPCNAATTQRLLGNVHFNRAVASGARHQFDVAELGQKMPSIVPIAAVASIVGIKLVEIAVDRRRHLILDDVLYGLPAKRAITLTPLQSIRLHCLHDFKCHR
jgi:hypothetical protein